MIVNNACADVADLYMCACGCTACAKIANCAGEITCSSTSDKKCTKCKDGYFLSRNKNSCLNGKLCRHVDHEWVCGGDGVHNKRGSLV